MLQDEAGVKHFSDFYERHRKDLRQQISTNPSLDLVPSRIGDVISKAGRNFTATPNVKQGYQRICSALIYAFNSLSTVGHEVRPVKAQGSVHTEVPVLLWARMFLALMMILIGSLMAGSTVVDVSCKIPASEGATTEAGLVKESQVCTQKVEVPQRGALSQTLVWLGLIFLTLEGLALLRRSMRRSLLARWLAPPKWLDPYALDGRQTGTETKVDSTIDARDLDQMLAHAFAELDGSTRYFAEPDAVETRIPDNLITFLQRISSLAMQDDPQRLLREMKNIPGLLEIYGLELITYNEGTSGCFDVVTDSSLSKPVTSRVAIRQKNASGVIARGEAFVPAR